jgi:DNA polymerase III subunit epsilon
MLEWLRNLIDGRYKPAPLDPEFWKAYLEKINVQSGPLTPLEETEFVVFDTETTGLDVRTDRVLSIGAIKVINGQVLVQESFECLVQQDVAQGNKSPEVHGILPSQVKQGLSEIEAIKSFLDFAGNATLVGHHVAFDIGMLNQIVIRNGISGKIENNKIDTAKLARNLERFQYTPERIDQSFYSLDALCKRYNLPAEERHTASGDAFTTAILLLKLLSMGRRKGMLLLGDLIW